MRSLVAEYLIKENKNGAGRGNRTPTLLPEPDFESGASTSSAIPAIHTSASCKQWLLDLSCAFYRIIKVCHGFF